MNKFKFVWHIYGDNLEEIREALSNCQSQDFVEIIRKDEIEDLKNKLDASQGGTLKKTLITFLSIKRIKEINVKFYIVTYKKCAMVYSDLFDHINPEEAAKALFSHLENTVFSFNLDENTIKSSLIVCEEIKDTYSFDNKKIEVSNIPKELSDYLTQTNDPDYTLEDAVVNINYFIEISRMNDKEIRDFFEKFAIVDEYEI